MKTLRVIWIDDERDPNKKMPFGIYEWWRHKVPYDFYGLCEKGGHPEIVWLKSYQEWLDWMIKWSKEKDNEYINCFCLDHDLASYDAERNEKTGVHVAMDICEMVDDNEFEFPYYECHSSNPAGRDNIISVFETYRKVNGKDL